MSSEKILRGVGTGGHGGAPIFRSNNPILTKRKTIYAHNLNTRPSPRALPNITSGPEVWQIFKIRTVRKPDIFLPRLLKDPKKVQKRKKKKKNQFFFHKLFFKIFLSIFDTKFVSRDLFL